jgi:thiosulfate/3-mercaptopyruvate sulfurtransferase
METYLTRISPQELSQHLDEPQWVIIDCRFDLSDHSWGEREYRRAHIPGAVYAHLERDLSAPGAPEAGRHPLPSLEAMTATFSRWGIDQQSQVVAYDHRGGGYAARLWWMLRYLGHSAVAVLDGGIQAWQAAGLPNRSGVEERSPRPFYAERQPGMLVTKEELLHALQDPSVPLIDSRAPERYAGLQEPLDPIAGRIPGARNRYWMDNLNADLTLKPRDRLRSEWEPLLAGAPPARAIVYCGSGVTACQNLLAMAHAGLQGARLYLGSWSEWCHDPHTPKITGGEKAIKLRRSKTD